jgi:DNA-binding response OmpR family regulator
MGLRRPKVLVVDDDENLALMVHRILYQENDRFDVLLAKSVEIALDILADVVIEVIVTDIQLPDKSGMDLLCWAAFERPDTRVIVMTGFDVDRIKDRAHALGCLRLLQKPFDLEEVRRTVLQALDRQDGFAGTLSELSCVDVLQMICLARKTTSIRFSDQTRSGSVYVEQGEVVHAVWNDQVGEEAFYGMMAVERGVFHTAPFPLDIERTITGQWQHLLMEGARVADEARRDRPSGDPPAGAAAMRPSNPGILPGRAPSSPPGLRVAVPNVPRLIDEGFAQLRAGRREEARKAWEEALRLDPGNRMIELNLRKLNGAPAVPRPALAATGAPGHPAGWSTPRGER